MPTTLENAWVTIWDNKSGSPPMDEITVLGMLSSGYPPSLVVKLVRVISQTSGEALAEYVQRNCN